MLFTPASIIVIVMVLMVMIPTVMIPTVMIPTVMIPTVIPIIIFPSKAVRCSRPCLGEDRRRDYDTHPYQIAAGTPDVFWG
jgi:hypothetical protein